MASELATQEQTVALSDRQMAWLRSELRTYERSGLIPKALQDEYENGVLKVDRSADRMLVAVSGAHLRLSIPTSFAHLHPIDGKVCQSAQLAVSLAMRAGHQIWTPSSSSERCTVRGYRAGHPEQVQELEWTLEDAHRAGLTATVYKLWRDGPNNTRGGWVTWVEGDGEAPQWLANPKTKKVRKDNWHNYPQAMLRARAQKAGVVAWFPEVLLGMDLGFLEDYVDDVPANMPPVVLNDGDVIDVEPEPDDAVHIHPDQTVLL